MREFRIKVNNEKTYVVKAKDYNQAVKTLHSKLNDDWSRGVSVKVKVTTESLIKAAKEHKVLLGGGYDPPEKFIGRSIRFTLPNKDTTAYVNIDNSQSTIHYNMYDDEFTYKEFGGKKDFNKAKLTEGLKKLQDYVVSQLKSVGIVVNQSKVEVGGSSKFNSTWRQAQSYNDSSVKDYDLTNFLALKRSLELRIGEEIDFDKLEEYVNKLPKDKNGKKNVDVKEVIKCCIKAKDNAVSDSISRYTGEDAIRTNGFVKIKEDGDWTSYKYNGSNFDSAVFKIHQYNPSLIAFVSNGNRTITVRNKYLNDSADTAQGEIEVLKSFGFDYKDGRWVKESNNNDIIVQPDYHYVSVIGPGDTEKHCKKYQYQSAGMLKKIIASNIKDSYITDTDMKTAEDIIKKYGGNPVGNVMGLQKTRFVSQDEIKNQHDFAIDLDKAGYKFYLINGRYRISPKDSSIKDDLTMVEKYKKSIIYIDDNGYYYHTPIGGRGAKAQRDNTKDINIVKKRIDNDYSFLYDSSIKDVDWDFANKLKQHSQEEIRNALKYSAPTVYKQYRNGETIQFAGLAGQLTGPEKTKVLKRLGDSNILSGYKYRITNNGSKWYYETTFPDGHTTLTGPYSSRQETEQYFHKHRPTEKLTDADPVKVEKIIRKEKSALGITYYIFQTKSSSGYTIYYQVTDKTYHGEPTYSGGGIISFSLKSANDTLDHNLLSDKLKAKYGEKEGTKRYLRGENDSAIKDKLSTSDANSLVEAYIDKYKYTHSNLPYVNKPKIKIFNSPEEFRDKFLSSHRGYSIYAGGLLNYNGYVVKLFTSAKDGKIESPSADNIFTIFQTTAIKDSANITVLTKKAKQLKNKLKKEKAHSYENWGQAEIRQLKDLFDYNNYSQSTKIINEFINWVDERTPGKIGDSNPNNIKNRKSYTIKVGDKQYKVFAESESEAVNKYIKSKKQ